MDIETAVWILFLPAIAWSVLKVQNNVSTARSAFTPLLNTHCGPSADGKTWTGNLDGMAVTYTPMMWGGEFALWAEASNPLHGECFEIDLNPRLTLEETRKQADGEGYHPEGWPAGIILDDFSDYGDNDWSHGMRSVIPGMDPSHLVALMNLGVVSLEAGRRGLRWKITGKTAQQIVTDLPETNRLIAGFIAEADRLLREAA